MSDTSLVELRKIIDTIDDQVIAWLNLRAETALAVGDLKSIDRKEIYDSKREQFVVDRIIKRNAGPLSQYSVEKIYGAIILACREIQSSP